MSSFGYGNFGRDDEAAATSEHIYYWIRAFLEGKMFMTGPYTDEQEAYQDGNSKLSDDFEVIPLRTRDPRRARSMLLRRRIDDGEEVMNVMNGRVKHTL